MGEEEGIKIELNADGNDAEDNKKDATEEKEIAAAGSEETKAAQEASEENARENEGSYKKPREFFTKEVTDINDMILEVSVSLIYF